MYLRLRLSEAGLLPTSKVALVAWYLLGLDLLLFVLQKVFGLLQAFLRRQPRRMGEFSELRSHGSFLVLAFRWVKAKALWRLRNRLIVTYVFIGVIPVVMLVVLALGSFYLFAGQFATFIVTTGLERRVEEPGSDELRHCPPVCAQMQRGGGTGTAALESLRQTDQGWADRQLCVWLDKKIVLNSSPPGESAAAPALPSYLKGFFPRRRTRSRQTLPACRRDGSRSTERP